jgi:hypothetical protein
VIGGVILNWLSSPGDGSIDHAGVLGWLLLGIALLAWFVAWVLRRRDRQTIVDIRLLGLRSLGSASAVLFTAGATLYAALFLLPLYYPQLRGETVLHAGLIMIPQGIGALAARLLVGKLVDRFVALQSQLAHGATSAVQGAFWWAIGITVAAVIPALALPTSRRPEQN